MSDDLKHLPVTHEEFARVWAGVLEVAIHVDELKKAYQILATRLESLDRHIGDLSKKVDEINPAKVDA